VPNVLKHLVGVFACEVHHDLFSPRVVLEVSVRTQAKKEEGKV
jgi:hypothetical protein